jgi:acyl-CoA reductase-like NAD-dependent aldehyde dehydrogenase
MAAAASRNGTHAETSLKSFEPASGELVGEVRVATRDDVAAAVARARKAQAAWSVLPVAERVKRLLRFRDALVDRAEEIVDVLGREAGKPRTEALVSEVFIAVDLLTYYCKNAERILAPRELQLHLLVHKRSVVHYVPRGVIGIISPWNFPFVIPMAEVFAALVTGSAAIVKPSELTPLVIQKAKEIFDSTGLPEDLFGVVQGGGDVGQALIEGGIQRLIFTGGVATGRKVAASCGENLVPCVMELGGKAPLVACADADVERAARAIVFGGFFNGGQACAAVERVYAHESIYDRLVDRVAELTRRLRVGDPMVEPVDIGAIIDTRQIGIAERHIADAVSKGARVLAGGKRKAGRGQFFEPTILADCTHAMSVMTEEIFGPIVPLMKVGSEDEMIRLANDSHLGLNAYVFTGDREKGRRLADRIEAGSVVVNDVLAKYGAAETPFGGVKQSGFGRVHGDDALRDMAEMRHVMSSRVPDLTKEPLWFPYSAKSYSWQLRIFRALFANGGVVNRLRALL